MVPLFQSVVDLCTTSEILHGVKKVGTEQRGGQALLDLRAEGQASQKLKSATGIPTQKFHVLLPQSRRRCSTTSHKAQT